MICLVLVIELNIWIIFVCEFCRMKLWCCIWMFSLVVIWVNCGVSMKY